MNRFRGQVSLELFFAISLSLLLFLWMSNFLQVFHSNTADAQSSAGAQIAARSLALLANRACVDGVSIQASVPCVMSGNSPAIISINSSEDPDPNTLFLHLSGRPFAAQAQSVCKLDTRALSDDAGNLLFVACNATNLSASPAICISSPVETEVKFDYRPC